MATQQKPTSVLRQIAGALVLITFFVLLPWEFFSLTTGTKSTSYSVTLNISSPKPIRSVKCQMVVNEEHGRDFLKEHRPQDSWSAVFSPFKGGPVSVEVPVSITHSPLLQRELRRYQLYVVVVVVVFDDGEQATKMVEVPLESDKTQSVSVKVP
ncbi:MAG: hypothetical protein IH991_10265 [Planctomycetes bacterium]|nr:hypothetical protein [Planctomycetota bacterium]